MNIQATAKDFEGKVTSCANSLIEILNSPEKQLSKGLDATSMVVLDACNSNKKLPRAILTKTEGLFDGLEKISESPKLNNCDSKDKIDELLVSLFYCGDSQYKNIIFYHENHKVRQLLEEHFPDLSVVRCPA